MRRSGTRAILHAGTVIALLLALRINNAFSLSANSDEAQHLHVVLAWTQAQPYRDVFDNHAPLFSLLCAPILSLLGERSGVIARMRRWMIPLYFGALYATLCIGRRLWNAETGAYTALLAGATPLFFTSRGNSGRTISGCPYGYASCIVYKDANAREHSPASCRMPGRRDQFHSC